MSFKNEVKIDQELLSRFNLLKPRDGNDEIIPLQKYVNDLLADSITGVEELNREKDINSCEFENDYEK